MHRLKQVCSLEVEKLAYFAFFESHLRYGIFMVGWGRHPNLGGASSSLERVLIRCTGLTFQESCRAPFTELKILTVMSLYVQDAIFHTSLHSTQASTHPLL